jgi:tRNA(Ile)-lysidine synthase TilS/MesJ
MFQKSRHDYNEFFDEESIGEENKMIKKTRPKKICSVCGLTTNYEFGEFSHSSGPKLKCKFCNQFSPPSFKGKDIFIKNVALKKNEQIGVSVSGGKDSIFAWSFLVDCFGPDKVLAFNHYKTGLVHPIALNNMKMAEKILKSKLTIVNDDCMFPRFKKNLGIFLDNPLPSLVRVVMCAGCRYGITEALYLKGSEFGVKKFVTGASYLELAPFKEELLNKNGQDNSEIRLMENLDMNPKYNFSENIFRILRDHSLKYKGGISNRDSDYTNYKGYKLFDLDTYIPNDPYEIEKFLVENLNWHRTESSWHFDCKIEAFKNLIYFGLLGYSEIDFKISSLVRHSLLSLDTAIILIEKIRDKMEDSYSNTIVLMKEMDLYSLIPKINRFYESSRFLKNPEKFYRT